MDNNTRKLLGITDPNIKFSDNWLLTNNKKQITYKKVNMITKR